MKFIIGKKIDMTQIWKDDKVVQVTRVQVGPCHVVQIKNEDKDGYKAAQVSYGETKEKKISKPQIGHLKKAGLKASKVIREFRLTNEDLVVGDRLTTDIFQEGDIIKVSAKSKGKGFQGVVKRHGFAGQSKTHGTKDQVRMPGSSGATGPAHVFKGMRMPGRMGYDRVSITNLEIAKVDKENNILFIKGGIPGTKNTIVEISAKGDLKIIRSEEKNTEEIKKDKSEEKKEETK